MAKKAETRSCLTEAWRRDGPAVLYLEPRKADSEVFTRVVDEVGNVVCYVQGPEVESVAMAAQIATLPKMALLIEKCWNFMEDHGQRIPKSGGMMLKRELEAMMAHLERTTEEVLRGERRTCTCGCDRFTAKMTLEICNVPVGFGVDGRMEYDDTKGQSDGWDAADQIVKCERCGKEWRLSETDDDRRRHLEEVA